MTHCFKRRITPVFLLLCATFFLAALSPQPTTKCKWNRLVESDNCATPEAYRPEHNGIMRLYNMFPRNYGNIDAMTADLPRIQAMGFTHVWLNPMHETTAVEKKKWPEGTPNGLKGSLYSMRDPFMINPDFSTVPKEERANMSRDEIWEHDKAAMQRFTAKTTQLGMVPMFDLVLSHLAPDSAIVDGTHPHYKAVDTKPWFARYENGEPKRHGLDQDGNILPDIKYPDKEVWDDVVMLDYETPEIRDQITEHLWKPFVDEYYDMGFRGIRVDSVANNNRDVMRDTIGHFRDRFQNEFGLEPTILGESLGGTMEQQGKIRGHATHLYNSAYWVQNLTGPNISDDKRDAKTLWQSDDNWFLHEAGQKQDIIFNDAEGNVISQRQGGTVGYAGSHDEMPWIYHFPKEGESMEHDALDAMLFKSQDLDYPLDEIAAVQSLREKVAVAALISDGGWFMTSFDDKADTTLRSVFDKQTEGVPLADLSPMVSDINGILKSMPQTEFGSWAKRRFLEDRDNLVIVERHTGFGYKKPSNVVIINTTPEQNTTLTINELQAIADMTRHNVHDFIDGKHLHFGRGVDLPQSLQQSHYNLSEGFAKRIENDRKLPKISKLDRNT
ncbi:MAG: hypothetical protein MK052_11095 [Alphaproteobacteria bacterium]|nr:hypothetical protein [Alphaproteobacteria bacterium]